MTQPVESLVELGRAGDATALERLVVAVQDRVYGLALRMLGDPSDAEDATQEILIKVVKNLAGFRGDSAFTTWVYRVASNHLLTTRKRRVEKSGLDFDGLDDMLERGLEHAVEPRGASVEDHLLEDEVKLGCTQSMLMCLDREHRVAFILAEVLELSSDEGAFILGTTPAAFRKRVSRARSRLGAFMSRRCGLVNNDSPCRCYRQVPFTVSAGVIDPGRLRFATHPVKPGPTAEAITEMKNLERLERVTAVFRSQPRYATRGEFAARMKKLVDSGHLRILTD